MRLFLSLIVIGLFSVSCKTTDTKTAKTNHKGCQVALAETKKSGCDGETCAKCKNKRKVAGKEASCGCHKKKDS